MKTRYAIVAAAVAAVLASTPATAHVPQKCGSLFHAAGAENDRLVARGNRATEISVDGLYQRPGRRYERLADELAQFLGAYAAFATKLTKAIDCANGK